MNAAASAGGAAAAVGLDLSATAVRDAEEYRDRTEPKEVAARSKFVVGGCFFGLAAFMWCVIAAVGGGGETQC